MEICRGVSLLIVALATAPASAGPCAHVEPHTARLDAAGATRLELLARAGTLRVEGRADVPHVSANGMACASSAAALAEVHLEARRDGTTLHLEARVPEAAVLARAASLDLTVEVPASLELSVIDTSGPIEIRNVASLTLEDGSGDLDVEGVTGDLRVSDGSGDARLAKISGEVWVRDGSGPVVIHDVGGSIVVEEDTTGSIEIAGVHGSVVIKSDSSGEIDVRDVGGDLMVEHKGSGEIRHADVKGHVHVPAGR